MCKWSDRLLPFWGGPELQMKRVPFVWVFFVLIRPTQLPIDSEQFHDLLYVLSLCAPHMAAKTHSTQKRLNKEKGIKNEIAARNFDTLDKETETSNDKGQRPPRIKRARRSAPQSRLRERRGIRNKKGEEVQPRNGCLCVPITSSSCMSRSDGFSVSLRMWPSNINRMPPLRPCGGGEKGIEGAGEGGREEKEQRV